MRHHNLTGRCDVPVEKRFWLRVNKDGPIHPVLGTRCWVWLGRPSSWGYGKIRVNGRQIPAHRYSYVLLVGPIPEGMLILHHCDNPACVNPKHLFKGTDADNNTDKELKGRGGHPKGFIVSQSTRLKISKAITGREVSEETRRKQSEAQKRRFSDPEQIRIVVENRKQAMRRRQK